MEAKEIYEPTLASGRADTFLSPWWTSELLTRHFGPSVLCSLLLTHSLFALHKNTYGTNELHFTLKRTSSR